MRQTPKQAATLRERWWWFNSANDGEKTEAALAWETFRRTKSYPALWRKCVRERAAFLGNEVSPAADDTLRHPLTRKQFLAHQHQSELEATVRGASQFRLMHLFQAMEQAILAPCFDFLMHGFDPSLTWLELPKQQRLLEQGYVFDQNKATKVNPEYVLPRQTPMEADAAHIRLCPVARDSTGKFYVSLRPHFSQGLTQVSDCPFFRGLQIKAPPPGGGPYVDSRLAKSCLSIYFDTRFGRDQLLAVLKAKRQFWESAPFLGTKRLGMDEVHIIPSDEPPFAIFLAPATCNKDRLLAAFHTQLKTPQRKKWFPRCVEHWKTLKVEIPKTVRSPDGSTQADARGFPVRVKLTRALFDPAKHLLSKNTTPKSARRVNPWLGLAANDVVEACLPLGKTSEGGAFLLDRCASSSDLRNHQRSAARRLRELDTSFGRADKNLAHWLNKSATLAQMGLFVAAAGKNA